MVQQQAEQILRGLYGSWSTGHTNFVFKLHYLVSFYLLSGFVLATSVQFYEKNYVNCINTKGETDENIDKYAYYFSTFTIFKDQDGRIDSDMTLHNYYFWVPVLFVYQLLVFRWTYYIWQTCGGKLLISLNEDRSKKKMFARYIAQRFELKLNDTFLFQLMFLELQNILVCVHQWVTTNYVLNGKFYRLGLNLSFEHLEVLFPYETKFTFRTYGPSGTMQIKDYLCILGLNALYKYVFSIYWCWLVLLTALTVINFIVRMSRLKIWFWEKHMMAWLKTNKSWFYSLRYSDWVFIKYLQTSVSLSKYRAVVRHLASPKMRRRSGHDMSIESSDESETEEDRNEENEEERRFMEFLDTIMFPIPMLTYPDNDDDVPEAVGSMPRDHSLAAEGPSMLEQVTIQGNSNDAEENAKTIGILKNVPDSGGSRNGGVSLYTLQPVQDKTKPNGKRPETDPLLSNVRDSETGSSKSSDEREGVVLNFRGRSAQFKTYPKN